MIENIPLQHEQSLESIGIISSDLMHFFREKEISPSKACEYMGWFLAALFVTDTKCKQNVNIFIKNLNEQVKLLKEIPHAK